jgi:hypothetical protein
LEETEVILITIELGKMKALRKEIKLKKSGDTTLGLNAIAIDVFVLNFMPLLSISLLCI